MRCNIPSGNSTLRSVRPLNGPYGSNGSLSLLTPSLSVKQFFFQVSLMRCNIPSVNSTLRSVRPLNDPYGSNELNKPLTDRYSAGVLDNPQAGQGKKLFDLGHLAHGRFSFNQKFRTFRNGDK